jgi:plasmid stabilization system protein ParE
MTLQICRSEWFVADLEHYTDWYDREAGWDVAEQYLHSVDRSLKTLVKTPGIGHPTRFKSAELRGIRAFSVERPFNKHLIFYRYNETVLYAERVIHGARDLPNELLRGKNPALK